MYKILIVEDEAILFLEMKDLLEENEYQIIGYDEDGYTKSYNEAIAVIQEEIPDMVLLDIELDGHLNGLDLAQKLNEFQIPFIYLSGNADSNTLERAKYTQPNTFLVKKKPFDDEQLIVTLKMALSQKSIIQHEGIFARETEKVSESSTQTLIKFNDIHFIETNTNIKNTITISIAIPNSKNLDSELKKYYVNGSLKHFQSSLPKNFIKTHRSYIINIEKIDKKTTGRKLILLGKHIPIGVTYEKLVLSVLDSHFLN